MKPCVYRISQKILLFSTIIMFLASVVNLLLLFLLEIPMLVPISSFSALRFMFIAVFEQNALYAALSILILVVILSSIFFIWKQKKIVPLVFSVYLVIDTLFLAYLFFYELFIKFYFDHTYFIMLLWHGGILTLLTIYFVRLYRTNKQ